MKKLVICLLSTVFFSTPTFANNLTEVSTLISSENLVTETTNENKINIPQNISPLEDPQILINKDKMNIPPLKEIETSITEDKAKAIKIFESYEDTNLSDVVFENFEHDNYNYIKDTVNIDRVTKEDTKEQIETLEVILSPNDKKNLSNAEIISLFQDTLIYEKDGYKGTLQKDLGSLKIEPNQIENKTTYTSQTITLSENRSYYGLENNDYGLIPKTITKNGVTLNLVDANFVSTNNEAISSVADTGVGTLYNCNALYKGSYVKKIPNTKTTILDYKATINYKGNVSKEIFEKNVVTVTYIGDKILDLTVPVVTTTGTGIFGFIVFLFVKKNAKIYNVIDGSYQLIGKCKITPKNKTINLTPISMKADSNAYKIVFNNYIAKKLNNQNINITLNNITKLKKLQYNEDNSFIDVTF